MNLDQVSDEDLARFIDGSSSAEEMDIIFNAVNSARDLEIIQVSATAISHLKESCIDDEMPDISELKKVFPITPFEKLPMAGFLGDNSDDALPINDEDDKQ